MRRERRFAFVLLRAALILAVAGGLAQMDPGAGGGAAAEVVAQNAETDAASPAASSAPDALAQIAETEAPARPSRLRVEEPGACYQCHPDIESEAEARHVHTAFGAGKCSACHNPHAARHAALLRDEAGDLCLSCHEGVKEEVARATVHAPAANGACGSCHDPHASAHPNQLVEAQGTLCGSCHEPAKEWSRARVVHAPIAGGGGCDACHAAHGTDTAHLTRTEVPGLCFDCHQADAAFVSAHQGRQISGSDCSACHDPHASGTAGLLRANQHAPFAAGDCGTCHGAMQGETPFAVAAAKTLCYDCHPSIQEAESLPHSAHLQGEGACTSCHNPHASNTAALLAAEMQNLCTRCHFNDEDRPKAEFLTHDAMECSTCHQPHGSQFADYLREGPTGVCESCHADAHEGGHPIGEAAIDPRTSEPMTCLSCHDLHGPRFEKYLPLDPARELCIQCHRK